MENLVSQGIINGYEDGTFRPQNTITRAEVCVVTTKAMAPGEQKLNEARMNGFPDVHSGYDWAKKYINYASAMGVIDGYPNGTFKPAGNVTYNELSAMVLKGMGYRQSELAGSWPLNFRNKALELGLYDGIYENGEESIHCFQNEYGAYEVHHQQNLAQAFAHSCNSAFAKIVTEDLDEDRFRKTLERMYFDKPLPYDLPCAESSSQLLEDRDISVHNLMQVAIGQGTTQVSPLHMNMITMAVANGGVLMRPYMVDHVSTAEGDLLQQYNPRQAGTLMDGETAYMVRQLMRAVTEVAYDEETGMDVWGTASEFNDTQNYIAFGKTGTAEFGDDEDSHAWFTGFTVDAEDSEDGDPQLCITVLIENGGVGSDKAVPIAKQILDRWYGQ